MHRVLVDGEAGTGPSAAPEDSVFQAAFLMEQNKRNPIMVRRGGVPVGIVTEEDIVTKVLATGRDPRKVVVGDIMEAGIVSGDGLSMLVDDASMLTSPLHDSESISKLMDLEPDLRRELAQRGMCEECETDQEFLFDAEGLVLCEECLEAREFVGA